MAIIKILIQILNLLLAG